MEATMSSSNDNVASRGLIRGPSRQRPYAKIYNDIIESPDISFNAKLVLVYLLSCSSNYVIYQTRICKVLMVGKFIVSNAIEELIKLGYVQRHRVKNKGRFNGWNTIVYDEPTFPELPEVYLDEPVGNIDSLPTSNKQTSVINDDDLECDLTSNLPTSNKQTSVKSPLTRLTNNKTKINNKNIKKILEADFQRFWEAYPKRVAKEAARKAFDKAMKKTDIETIIKAVKSYAEKVDLNFCNNPATWLNADRWLDEYKSETKAEPIKTSDFKKRYGIDKLICDKIMELLGGAYFKSYVENNNAEFSEDEDGKLKLSIATKFTCDRILDDCTNILHNLGYDFVEREITGLKAA